MALEWNSASPSEKAESILRLGVSPAGGLKYDVHNWDHDQQSIDDDAVQLAHFRLPPFQNPNDPCIGLWVRPAGCLYDDVEDRENDQQGPSSDTVQLAQCGPPPFVVGGLRPPLPMKVPKVAQVRLK
jgi:hypothetical protein